MNTWYCICCVPFTILFVLYSFQYGFVLFSFHGFCPFHCGTSSAFVSLRYLFFVPFTKDSPLCSCVPSTKFLFCVHVYLSLRFSFCVHVFLSLRILFCVHVLLLLRCMICSLLFSFHYRIWSVNLSYHCVVCMFCVPSSLMFILLSVLYVFLCGMCPVPFHSMTMSVCRSFHPNISSVLYHTGASETSTSKSLEQEKYFSTVVLNTPYGSYYKSDSLVSLNTIIPASNDAPDGTPIIGSRRHHEQRSGTLLNRGFLRSSGGKSVQGFRPSKLRWYGGGYS